MPSLLASLGLNVKPFERGLHDAQHAAKHAGSEIGRELLNVGTSMAGGLGIAEILRETVESASRIKQLSELFHVSTDQIQLWDRAAAKVGMTAEDMGNALNRLAKSRAAAVGKGDVGAFGSFGIGMDDLKNSAISVEEILGRIRSAAEGHPLTEEQDVAGMELMGKSGAKVLSILEQLNTLGPVHLIQSEDIENLHEAELRLKDFNRELQVGMAMLAGGAVKGSNWFANHLMGFLDFGAGDISGDVRKKVMSGEEASSVAAPTRDLKGRLLKQHEAPDRSEESRNYSKVQMVDLHKDDLEISKLKAQLEEKVFQAALKTMSVEERRSVLNQQIAEHQRKAIEQRFAGDEVAALKEDLEVQTLKDELAGTAKKKRMRSPDVTERQKIGAYASLPGAAGNNEKSAEHLKFIAEWLRATGLKPGEVRTWSRNGPTRF